MDAPGGVRRARSHDADLDERRGALRLRHLHPALRVARARAERRRRLRGPARPRLRRLLRHRRVRVRAALFRAVRPALAVHRVHPARRRGDRARRPRARHPRAAPARGLPRDRHALLRPGVRVLREQQQPDGRRQGPHGRTERDRGPRSVERVRLGALEARALLLLPARRLHARGRGAVPAERVADRTSVEGAARGPARRRGDGHPREPAEDRGLHDRRRDGWARRVHLRGAAHGRVPGQLRRGRPDHDLRDRHPRGPRAASPA